MYLGSLISLEFNSIDKYEFSMNLIQMSQTPPKPQPRLSRRQVLGGDWEEDSSDTPKRQMTKAKSDPRVPNNGTGWAETS